MEATEVVFDQRGARVVAWGRTNHWYPMGGGPIVGAGVAMVAEEEEGAEVEVPAEEGLVREVIDQLPKDRTRDGGTVILGSHALTVCDALHPRPCPNPNSDYQMITYRGQNEKGEARDHGNQDVHAMLHNCEV